MPRPTTSPALDPAPPRPLTRRAFVSGTAALGVWLALPRRARANEPAAAREAAATSPLIYVSPLKTDGSESRCHAEVWFVRDGGDLLVVSEATCWRAVAISRGLDRARIWVGDFGVWKRSQGAFRKAPSYVARGVLDRDPTARARALEAYGRKYADEWGKWGPRFEKGLASGDRVLIRYAPAA